MTVYLWLPKGDQEGVLASDKRYTRNSAYSTNRSHGRKSKKLGGQKIRIINDNLAYAFSGSSGSKILFDRLLRENDDPLELYLKFEKTVKKFFNNTRKFFGSYLVIFSGIPGEDGLRVYNTMGGSNKRTETKEISSLFTIGSGRKIAYEYAKNHWTPYDSIQQSINTAANAIESANQQNEFCNGLDIVVATMNGFRRLDRDTIAHAWDASVYRKPCQ
ncbi:MAG: hypothetical protein ABIA21_01435 [Candidatus Aenigmatarchaeota archaeon]